MKEDLRTRKGKSVDMQNELRGFYQTIRNSDICYTTIQTKNPFTMLWATDASPLREKGRTFESGFITTMKEPIGKDRSRVSKDSSFYYYSK